MTTVLPGPGRTLETAQSQVTTYPQGTPSYPVPTVDGRPPTTEVVRGDNGKVDEAFHHPHTPVPVTHTPPTPSFGPPTTNPRRRK